MPLLFGKNAVACPGSKVGRLPVPERGGMLDVTASFGCLSAMAARL